MGSISHMPISIVVIGAGTIGRKHINLVSKSTDAVLAAIVDPTAAGKELAKECGCTYFIDVNDLLSSNSKAEAAIVCTPNETHVSISKQLAEAGIHLLVEKPMSTSVAEGLQLIDVCRAQRVRLCVGHHRRFHPSIITAKQALESGAIGRALGVSGLWASLKTESYFQGFGQWRAGDEGGLVLINLIHELDLLQFLLGPIVRVYAERAASTRGHVAEEGVAVTLRFDTGVVGTFLALDNSPSPFSMERGTGEFSVFPFTGKDCYRIFGQEGAMSVPDGLLWTPESLEKGWYSDIRERRVLSDTAEVFEKQLENFVGVVRGYEQPSCTGEAGLAAVAACAAVRESLKTGLPVEVASLL